MASPNPFLRSSTDDLVDELSAQAAQPIKLPEPPKAAEPAPSDDATPAATDAATAPRTSNQSKGTRWLPNGDLLPIFEDSARQYNVPVNAILALAHQESRYNTRAVGQETEWGRAKGIMQYLDGTAKGLGINPLDPSQAIPAAAKQLRERLDKGDSLEDAIKAHFAGDDRKRWGAKTAAYGQEVMGKVARIGEALGTEPVEAGSGAPAAAEQAAPQVDLSKLQADLDADEAGRYKVLTDDYAATHFSPALMGRDAYEQIFRQNNPGASDAAVSYAMGEYDKQQPAAQPQTVGPKPVPTPEQFFDQRLNQRLQQAGAGGVVPALPGKMDGQPPAPQPTFDPAKASQESGFDAAASYLGRAAESGFYDLAGAGAKVLDAINPWTLSPGDAAVLFKDDPAKLKHFQDESAAMVLSRFAAAMTKNSEEAQGKMSDRAKRDYGGLEYATLDPNKTAFSSPVKVIGDAVRSLPTTAAMAVSVYLTRGAAAQAEKNALAAGLSEEAARQAAVQAGAKAMATTGAVTEGATGYAQQANQTASDVSKVPMAELAKSPKFQQLLKEGYTPETARAQIIADTSEQSGQIAGIVDAAVNKVGGEFLGKVLTEGGKLIPRIMKGAGNEAATETVQSAGEQFGQNVATQQNVNPQQDLSQGVGEAAVAGGAVGGLMGGVTAGAGGRGHVEQAAAPAEQPSAPPPTVPPSQVTAVPAAVAPAPKSPTPLSSSLESTAEQPQRVIATTPDGQQAAGTVIAYQESEDGGFVARIVGDDGQVVTVTDQDGVQLTPVEAPKGPLTASLETAADQHAAAPAQTEPQAASGVPEATAESAPLVPVAEPVAPPARQESPKPADMSDEQLRARLQYLASQFKNASDRGVQTKIATERRAVEKEINARAKAATANQEVQNATDRTDRGASDRAVDGNGTADGNRTGGNGRADGLRPTIDASAGRKSAVDIPDASGPANSVVPLKNPYAAYSASSAERAQAYMEKRGADPEKFEVKQTGKVRWQVVPKQAVPAKADKQAAADAKYARQEEEIAKAAANIAARAASKLSAVSADAQSLQLPADGAVPDSKLLTNGPKGKPGIKKPATKAAAKERAKQVAAYFTPGNVVNGYGGHDRVIEYTPPDETGRWNVSVRGVVKQDGEWVRAPGEDGRLRNHSTMPDDKELKAGPVQRAEAEPRFSVTPEQAAAIDMETKIPTDPLFAEAVVNTPGASVGPEGLRMTVVRYQKDDQEGARSVRTGVFYLPAGSAAAKHYKTGKNGYGGTQKHEGETVLRAPLFVKGATGGKAPEVAYDTLKGKKAYENMRNDVLEVATGWGKTEAQKYEGVYQVLEQYGADPDLADEIVRNSREGNTLPYAVQENIVAHAVRDAGYDSVVGYSKGKAGAAISEVFDVRETTYPARGMDSEIHPDFPMGNYSIGEDGKSQAEFGPVHTEFRDNPAAAVDRLMADKDGEAIVHVDGLGDVSLIYGNGRTGLSHIAARRGSDFMDRLPALLKDGTLYSKPGQKDRVFIGNDRDEAVVRFQWDGQSKTWLLSAYEKYPDLTPAAGVRESHRADVVAERTDQPLTKETLRKSLKQGVLGPVIDQMVESGIVVLHDGQKTLPKELGGKVKGVQAVTMQDGTVHMVAANLNERNARAVMLHEAFHQGGERLLGTAEWGNMMGRLSSLYRQSEQSGGKAREFFDRARGRVAAAKRKGAVSTKMEVEEFAAYAIEEYETKRDSMPAAIRKWVEDLIGLVKAWAQQRFGKQIGKVTPAQLSALAKMAMMDVAVSKRGEMFGPIGELFSTAEDRTSVPRVEPPSLIPPEQGRLRRLQATVQDNMNRVKQVQERIEELTGSKIGEKADYYGAETNRPGRIAARLEDAQDMLFEPLMQRLAKSGHTQEQLEELLHAQHAEERNEAVARINPDMPDGGSGMMTDVAQAIIESNKGNAELLAIAQQARDVARATLDLKKEYDLINKETYDTLATQYENYVPLKGDGEFGPKVKRAMGHDTREEHILENIARDYDQAVVVGEKNLARQSLLRMVLANPDPDLWTVGVPPKGRYVAGKVYSIQQGGREVARFTSQSQVNAFLEAKGQAAGLYQVYDSNGERVAEFTRPLQDNEVMVYVKGDPVRIQIHGDEALARQLRPLNQGQMHPILEFMRGMNRYLSKIYTGYNPSFILRNAARDAMTGTINMAGHQGALTAAKAWAKYPQAVATLARWAATGKIPRGETGAMLSEYRAHGGKTGASYMSDLEAQGKNLNRLFEDAYGAGAYAKDGKPVKAAKVAGRKIIGGMAHVVEIANQATENGLRLALYMALREQGATPAKAAQAAKTVTVDFDRKGTQTGAMGALYLFFNPAVQGTANAIKTLAKGEHKAQAWAALGGLVALGAWAASKGMDDDKDRWLGEGWETRTKNFIVNVGDRQFRMPMSQEFAPAYAMGVAIAEAGRGEGKMKAAAHIAASFLDAYFPFQGAYMPESDNHQLDAALAMVPTVLKTPVQSAVNRNSFGSQIVPENEMTKDRPDNLKMFRGTKGSPYEAAAQGIASIGDMTGAGKYENDITKVSPETLKMLWKTYTGGLGTFVGDTISAGRQLADGEQSTSAGDVPIAKDFIRNNDVKAIRGRYYDLTKEARAAVTEFDQAKKAGDADAMKKFMADSVKSQVVALGKMTQKVNKAAASIRDEAVDINARTDLSAAEKKVELKKLEQQEEALYRDAIEAFK